MCTGELQGDVRSCRTAAIGILNRLNPFSNFDSSSCNSLGPRPTSIQNLSDNNRVNEDDIQENKRKRIISISNNERRMSDIDYNLDEKDKIDYNTYSGEHAEDVLKGGHIPFDFEKKMNNDHVKPMKDDICDQSEKTTDNDIECDKNEELKIWTNKSDGNITQNEEKNIPNNINEIKTEKEEEIKRKDSTNNHDNNIQKPFIPLASPVVRGLAQQRRPFSISQCHLSNGDMMTPDIYYLEMYKTMSDSVRVGTYVAILYYRILV